MDVLKIIITVLGYILLVISSILIFDARHITEKWFSFGDRNEGVRTLKIVGFITFIIGGLMIIFSK